MVCAPVYYIVIRIHIWVQHNVYTRTTYDVKSIIIMLLSSPISFTSDRINDNNSALKQYFNK